MNLFLDHFALRRIKGRSLVRVLIYLLVDASRSTSGPRGRLPVPVLSCRVRPARCGAQGFPSGVTVECAPAPDRLTGFRHVAGGARGSLPGQAAFLLRNQKITRGAQ